MANALPTHPHQTQIGKRLTKFIDYVMPKIRRLNNLRQKCETEKKHRSILPNLVMIASQITSRSYMSWHYNLDIGLCFHYPGSSLNLRSELKLCSRFGLQ